MATYGEAKVACEHAVVEGVDCVEVSAQGTFNVCGPVTRFADHLDVARRVAAHSGPGLSPQDERHLIAVDRS